MGRLGPLEATLYGVALKCKNVTHLSCNVSPHFSTPGFLLVLHFSEGWLQAGQKIKANPWPRKCGLLAIHSVLGRKGDGLVVYAIIQEGENLDFSNQAPGR